MAAQLDCSRLADGCSLQHFWILQPDRRSCPRRQRLGRRRSSAPGRSPRRPRLHPPADRSRRRKDRQPEARPLRDPGNAAGVGGREVTRRRIALLLTALVAASGVLPLLLLAVFGLQILSQRGERASQEALHAIATQAAARIGAYIAQQREMLRTIGTAVADEA